MPSGTHAKDQAEMPKNLIALQNHFLGTHQSAYELLSALQQQQGYQHRRLLQALTAGALGATLIPIANAAGRRPLFGRRPKKMANGQSIYSLRGEVWVDKQPATTQTLITPGSLVETGDTSRVVFVVGKDSFLLRSNSRLELKKQRSDTGGVIKALRLFGVNFYRCSVRPATAFQHR